MTDASSVGSVLMLWDEQENERIQKEQDIHIHIQIQVLGFGHLATLTRKRNKSLPSLLPWLNTRLK